MLDIISDLKEKKSEVISLHEVITTLKSQSPQATLPQIAEWLLIQLADNPESPEMGILTVGGGFESILPEWMSAQNEQYLSLRDLLIELYRSNGIWPGDIPF
ncbi:hypothetical protein JQ098_004127 [Salmonella enterica subsp. enterica serovar Typhimurium]|jgi:hypothetical protein|uniref:Uncharacterized protein n=12 Tax=Salmonella enterica TaxID=28901 RepID=A0A5V7YXI9_SALEB|nr:hypothetical protein [Salmonella enterica]EAA0561784.1 hypothetical protein [Salmonella enterica subsp. enterica serovar Lexington]EAA1790720.1 hypothetical protein [Salmonella enterica subsp. enterica serovar Virchow]EAA1888422.1 hypothetical protein [Salmonella enterica subsp. enterica serovar Fluntern]EAA3831991.1 hypothetical protein [Salmonella enterica subsp. enterica serovar Java]EAA6274894.1 hypothetical protein [Salmonella enterica subsp. enterica serovar Telhashomer]EBF8503131.1 